MRTAVKVGPNDKTERVQLLWKLCIEQYTELEWHMFIGASHFDIFEITRENNVLSSISYNLLYVFNKHYRVIFKNYYRVSVD